MRRQKAHRLYRQGISIIRGFEERHADNRSGSLDIILTKNAKPVENVIFRVRDGVLNPRKAQGRLEVVNSADAKVHELINGFLLKNRESVLDPRERFDLAGDTRVVSGEPTSMLRVIES